LATNKDVERNSHTEFGLTNKRCLMMMIWGEKNVIAVQNINQHVCWYAVLCTLNKDYGSGLLGLCYATPPRGKFCELQLLLRTSSSRNSPRESFCQLKSIRLARDTFSARDWSEKGQPTSRAIHFK